jgi:hypothetical protein
MISETVEYTADGCVEHVQDTMQSSGFEIAGVQFGRAQSEFVVTAFSSCNAL